MSLDVKTPFFHEDLYARWQRMEERRAVYYLLVPELVSAWLEGSKELADQVSCIVVCHV